MASVFVLAGSPTAVPARSVVRAKSAAFWQTCHASSQRRRQQGALSPPLPAEQGAERASRLGRLTFGFHIRAGAGQQLARISAARTRGGMAVRMATGSGMQHNMLCWRG